MDRHGLICRTIQEHPDITQRELSRIVDVSLGSINTLMKDCISRELIAPSPDTNGYQLLSKGLEYLTQYKVDGALIIAAGFGSRFVPLTFDTPKGLLEVFGERMIERQIRQLHEKGIYNITIAVGYLKEKFEYLIDKYQVKLLYNPEYNCKNTLATIYHARHILKGKNMYLLSSDNWMKENMFHHYECGSWYSSVYMEGGTSEWCLHCNRKGSITKVEVGGQDCWVMYGPVFLSSCFSNEFLPILESYYHIPATESFYWEQVYLDLLSGEAENKVNLTALNQKNLDLSINRQPDNQVYEFENLEELRIFDSRYQDHSDNQALELISEVFSVSESEITQIRCLKAGMTNRSFLFSVNNHPYICRIPGAGTEVLINRKEEKAVYDVISNLDYTEDLVYFNEHNGYKIAKYYEHSRNADSKNQQDMKTCISLVRSLHNSGLTVSHSFDLRERIGFYENLCLEHGSIPFEDYREIRSCMDELLHWLDGLNRPSVLAHIDSNVDNFLFLSDGTVKLIDWEYAGMCDPLIDIAMCAIYSYYNEDEINWLLETYLDRVPTETEQCIVYAYAALGGFLWSLWAIYKSFLGEEFGEYTIIMYRYGKQFYQRIRLSGIF